MLFLPDCWVWDSWYAQDGEHYHAFYLKASRALIDPDRRHWRAIVGHSVSTDLTNWTELPDALVPADAPAFDDGAIWTGSVVRADDGSWRMYYTGNSRAENQRVQRIGLATSTDLITWERFSPDPIVSADHRWYESQTEGTSDDEAWRDPWVMRTHDGGWEMLITARANRGPADVRGVVARAVSGDGLAWTVVEPWTAPGYGFSQLEVNQIAEIDGRKTLIFCCGRDQMSDALQAAGEDSGIFAIDLNFDGSPHLPQDAYRLAPSNLYAGRLVQRSDDGRWVLLAFVDRDTFGHFGGTICDPIPISRGADGRLALRS